MAERVEEYVSAGRFAIPVRLSVETTPLSTAGAARLALELFWDTTFMLMNGDSYADVDLRAIRDAHRQRQALATIAVCEVDDTARYGSVAFDGDLAITAFTEKAASTGTGFINAGVYVVERSALAAVPLDTPTSLERDVFPTWAGRGLYAFPFAGTFFDIGTPEDYARAQTQIP